MSKACYYMWRLNRDCLLSKNIIHKIGPETIVNFDLSILKELDSGELIKFRNKFLELLHLLKHKRIMVDYDSIRLQSIRYNVLLIGPRELQLDVSDVCNYRCTFCLTHSRLTDKSNGDGYMPFIDVRRIINSAYRIGTETIYLSGHGEPLLHPRIINIISYSCRIGLKTTVLTNASIEKKVSEILKLPATRNLSFLLNLAAVNPEKFSLIHNGDPECFFSILNNIKLLNKRYGILLSYIIYKDNISDIFEFTKLAYSLGVKAVKYRFPNFYDTNYEKLRFSTKDRTLFLKNIHRAKNFARNHNMKIDLQELVRFYLYKLNKIKIERCYRGWFFSNVKVTGEVYNCCIENKPLGKVTAGNFEKVFFSPHYFSFILGGKKSVSVNSKKWRKCKFCPEYDRSRHIDNLIK